MIEVVNKKASTEEVLGVMHPVVAEWFRGKFDELTEAQAMAVPIIHARENVLVSSPTGSGKTLTAFMSILNELILLDQSGGLEDRIYAVYVSPLKALANDVNLNLLRPLAEISALFERKGLSPPSVRVGLRTGDTLASERQRQLRTPPHIFITTPESLSLVLTTPVFRGKFEQVEYVILDEVHEVCDSKRGVALSVALERLQSTCQKQFVRIGLSATVAPIDEVASYLVGFENGEQRPVKVVEVFGQRALDLRVLCPAMDMTALSFEVVNSKMYDALKEMIDVHKTTLVFTNTRSGTESVVYKLRERGLEDVGAHHGSLSRDTRLGVEEELRNGALRAVVSSTSLELGIDIGHIDLVVQVGSPKSVSKGLQRIGRSGHQYGGVSKGRMLVFENDDLVECAVLCRAAHKKLIDRVTIPSNALDVLAQVIVALSIERTWEFDEALRLVRQSHCYKDLTEGQLLSVMRYLGGKDEFEGIYSKIWYDEKEGRFGRKRGSRMIFYLNQGTIPEEADYKVYSERGAPLGSLSEKFVERLSAGDIFVLGGRSYEFLKTKGTKAFVKSASGRRPTVPSWTGEMLPRSFDLSVLIGQFRREMDDRLGRMSANDIAAWLMDEFFVDEGSANTIISYFREQKMVAKLPTDDRLVIEGYVDVSGVRHAIFHFPFGRRVNDALSRAFAHALSEKLRCNVTISVTDDTFMLTAPKKFELDGLDKLVKAEDLESMLRRSVRDSELFHQRFRHTATRSFMVLRNYKGRELSVARQQLRSRRLLDALHELNDFPVMSETYSEILTEVMDIGHAKEVLLSLEDGQRHVEYVPFSGVPSPLAHNVVLIGVSDIVLMEDRSMLLREMHRKVLARVMGDKELSKYQFEEDEVAKHFGNKFPRVKSKDDILAMLEKVGPMNLFKEKAENVFSHTDVPFDTVRAWSSELLRAGKVRSVWIGEDLYTSAVDWPLYQCIHLREHAASALEAAILAHLAKDGSDVEGLVTRLDAPRNEVRDALKRLEIANQIYRCSVKGDRFSYRSADAVTLRKEDCVKEAIRRHLSYHAPLSVEDLAYEIGVQEQDATDAVRGMVSQEEVVSGRFLVGEQQQYMMALDYLQLKSGGERVLDRGNVRKHIDLKLLSPVASIRGYFERLGEAGMAYDLYQRVDGFSVREFEDMRTAGELLLGRFVRGKLRYVLAEDVPYYLGAFRRERLNRFENSILNTLRKMESGTYQEIASATAFPPDAMREHFDSLDRKGYLLRLYDGAEAWTSRNTYVPCEVEPESSGALEHVLKRYLGGFGPVTLSQAAFHLDVEPEDARALLRKVKAKEVSVGLDQMKMWALPKELALLDHVADYDDSVRVLSLYDPFLADKWTEVTSRFGEGWIFPIVYRGQIVGMVEKWLMAGAVEIREVLLDDKNLLGRLLDSIDRLMVFYGSMNADIVRIKTVFGTEPCSLEPGHLETFHDHGYTLSNSMLVKGPVVEPCFERSEILDVIFSLQHFEDADRFETVEEMLSACGGIRSDAETLTRVNRFESLDSLMRRGVVVRGHMIPERSGCCRLEEARLFSAARAGEMTEEERLLLRVVRDQQPVKRERLLTLSTVGPEKTIEAIRTAYLSSQLYLDSARAYVVPKRSRMSLHKAWDHIIRRLFTCFGIMTAETLSSLLGRDLSMREVRAALRRLEREGFVVKGHLLRGSSVIHWASIDAFDRLGKASPSARLVVSPSDMLTQFLRASHRDVLPETGRYAVFSGSRLLGSFDGRLKKNKLEVADITGEGECVEIISSYAHRLGLALTKKDESHVSEWEVMEFYHKSHPGA